MIPHFIKTTCILFTIFALTIRYIDAAYVVVNCIDKKQDNALLTIVTVKKPKKLKEVYNQVKDLVAHYANPSACDQESYSVLTRFVRHILASPDLKQEDRKNATDILDFLLTSGADINAGDKVLGTPLIYAIGENSLWAVQELVKRGADIGVIKNRSHKTALEEAEEIKENIKRDELNKWGYEQPQWYNIIAWLFSNPPDIDEKKLSPIYHYLKNQVGN